MNVFIKIAAAISLFYFSAANAGVVIGGTRVIYEGNKKEASINVSNQDSIPYLIQSWIESPDNHSEKPPFIITPPLYRLNQGQKNVERIVMTGELPQDKESLYWLNIKAIPSSDPKDNTLQIAVKTRIKLIYRPAALHDSLPEALTNQLSWHCQGNQLVVSNPTPVVMNFNEITVGGKSIANVSYVLPGDKNHFESKECAKGHEVIFKIINDYGGMGQSVHSRIQ